MRPRLRSAGVAVAVLIIGSGWFSVLASNRDSVRAAELNPELAAAGFAATGVAGSIPLDAAIARIRDCRSGVAGTGARCAAVVYVWSPLMPLSGAGISEARRATQRLEVDLLVIDGSELERRIGHSLPGGDERSLVPAGSSPGDPIATEMIAAGATLHYPSLLAYSSGRLAGTAILGYKTGAAYRSMIDQRLRPEALTAQPRGERQTPPPADTLELALDFAVPGRPGAYFRSVAGRQTLAYEAGSTVYLLDLTDGTRAVAPGHIDFVPTPDGRLFVTPNRRGRGLEFYDADEVFRAASSGAGGRVEPIHVDREVRDQYPSVGILEHNSAGTEGGTVYRILTSWFDGIAFRDYEVLRNGARGRVTVRPLGPRRGACPRVSIPILSPDGEYLAGRDETSASTKIFRISEQGECREVADLRLQTGKVAWSPDGDRLAFAIPRGAVRDGSGTLWIGRANGELAGIFVYDRTSGETRRVPGSENANRLTFPEFVGSDSLVFLLSPQARGEPSIFRLVCCIQ